MSYCLTPFFSACTGAADPALLKCFVQHVSQPYLFYQHSSAVSKSPTEAQHCFKKKCNTSRIIWTTLQWGRWVLGLQPYPCCPYGHSACRPWAITGQLSTGRARCASHITAILSFDSRPAGLALETWITDDDLCTLWLPPRYAPSLRAVLLGLSPACIRRGMQKQLSKRVRCG